MYPETPITLADVARVAGVSRTTASQVLSGTGRASAQTRARVTEAAATLGYVANIGAQNFRKSRAGAIGLCLPPSTTSLAYYMEFTFGVIERAQESGIAVTLLLNRSDGGGTDPSQAHVDGFVIVDPEEDDAFVARILQSNRLVVAGERVPSSLPEPAGTVSSDHRAAMSDLLTHLERSGARNVGLILPGVRTAWAQEIHDSYLAWVGQRRLEPHVAISPRRIDVGDVHRITTSMLASAMRPDAIISTPDGTAIGALAAISASGLSVGRDVLLSGYGDSMSLQMSNPPVTAVDLRPRAFGNQCAELLLQLLADRSLRTTPQHRHHGVKLNVRASTLRSK